MNFHLLAILLVLLFGFPGRAEGCVTNENKAALNTTVQALIDALVNASLAIQNNSTQAVSVEDAKIPQMLSALCQTPSIKEQMHQIEQDIGNCPQLMTEGDVKLHLIQIKGVGFAQLFASFLGVDQFCECQTDLPAAWLLRDAALTYTDQSAIYTNISDASAICGTELMKAAITNIGGKTGNCADILKGQAGFDTTEKKARLDRLKALVDGNCDSFNQTSWNCIKENARSPSITNCKTWASNLDDNKIPCAKRLCVTTFIGGPCGTGPAELYIKAVNVETATELSETETICSGLDIACVNHDGVLAINRAVKRIFDGLSDYINLTSGRPVVEDTNIPAVFSSLCNTSLKDAMIQIQTEVTRCLYSTLLATNLGSLTIKNISFGQFFAMFSDVDRFCACSSSFPQAWALRADTTPRVYEDPTAAYLKILDVSRLCGPPLKPLLHAVGSAEGECKAALRLQAGISGETSSDFDEMYGIVEKCGTNAESDWTCMKRIASNSEFKSCVTTEGNKVGDGARCGKWECVKTHMHECTNNARTLYIKAVNAENQHGIMMDGQGCGASGLHVSLLALAICVFLLF